MTKCQLRHECVNRCDDLPHDPAGKRARGWHPTLLSRGGVSRNNTAPHGEDDRRLRNRRRIRRTEAWLHDARQGGAAPYSSARVHWACAPLGKKVGEARPSFCAAVAAHRASGIFCASSDAEPINNCMHVNMYIWEHSILSEGRRLYVVFYVRYT